MFREAARKMSEAGRRDLSIDVSTSPFLCSFSFSFPYVRPLTSGCRVPFFIYAPQSQVWGFYSSFFLFSFAVSFLCRSTWMQTGVR